MKSTQGRSAIYTAAAAILLLGVSSTPSHAASNDTQGNNGQHTGWSKKDKDKAPVSVPEPGTMALLIAGLAAAMSLGRKGPKV